MRLTEDSRQSLHLPGSLVVTLDGVTCSVLGSGCTGYFCHPFLSLPQWSLDKNFFLRAMSEPSTLKSSPPEFPSSSSLVKLRGQPSEDARGTAWADGGWPASRLFPWLLPRSNQAQPCVASESDKIGPVQGVVVGVFLSLYFWVFVLSWFSFSLAEGLSAISCCLLPPLFMSQMSSPRVHPLVDDSRVPDQDPTGLIYHLSNRQT